MNIELVVQVQQTCGMVIGLIIMWLYGIYIGCLPSIKDSKIAAVCIVLSFIISTILILITTLLRIWY